MVTMRQIAEKAGVSRTAVAFVLNGRKYASTRISASLCRRIAALARDMGYERNALASAISTGKTQVLAFMTMDMGWEYASLVLSGAMQAASRCRYFIKLFPVNYVSQFAETVHRCLEHRPAGIICRPISREFLAYLRARTRPYKIPVAVVDCYLALKWGIQVKSDDETGTRLAVAHLVKLGHRRIAHVTDSLAQGYATLRCRGYRQGLKDAGLPLPKEYILATDDRTQRERLVRYLLSRRASAPTALFCTSDMIAMDALRVGHALGLHIPRDLSVVGYGNLNMSEYADPPLTTVAQPFIEMGQLAVHKLIREINAPAGPVWPKPDVTKLETRLVIRASTGPYQPA